jgi:hypothetical protein
MPDSVKLSGIFLFCGFWFYSSIGTEFIPLGILLSDWIEIQPYNIGPGSGVW